MKTKLLAVALAASAALIAPAQGGNNHGGGGGGHFASGVQGAARSGGHSSFRSMPTQRFGGGRMMYSGQRFSSFGQRSPRSMGFRPYYAHTFGGRPMGSRQFTPRNINRSRVAPLSNGGNHSFGNLKSERNGQFRNGNKLPGNWQHHVFAQRSGNWHRDWNRHGDHTWHGHHCRFINGSWVIFDLGFYPWWGYDYGYPYDYSYPYGYYNQGYGDQYGYSDDQQYYDQNDYSPDQSTGSTVAAAQERLAQEGYYRGEIDGVIGPVTQRAVARYQSNRGLPVSGVLTAETIAALGLRQVPRY